MFRNGLQPWHLVLIAIVILILFGWKKLPDMTRSFGRSARILRSEMDEMKNDKTSDTTGPSVPQETHTTRTHPGPTPGAPVGTAPAVPIKHDVPTKDVEHDVPVNDPAGHHSTA